MDLILENAEHFSILTNSEIEKYVKEELLDFKYFDDKKLELESLLKGISTVTCNSKPYGRNYRSTIANEDEKENFLMPAPRGKVRKKRTTRTTSRISSELLILTKLADPDPSLETSNKSQRTTRKGRSTNRVSKPNFKCNLSTYRRSSIEPKRETKSKSSVLVSEEIVGLRRTTRSRSAKSSMSVDNEVIGQKRMIRSQVVNNPVTSSASVEEVYVRRVTRSHVQNISECVPTSSKNDTSMKTEGNTPLPKTKGRKLTPNINIVSTTPSQTVSGPFTPNSVKQHVNNFEKLISDLASEGGKGKKKKKEDFYLDSAGKKDNSVDILSPKANKLKSKIDSPIVKSKTKNCIQKGLASRKVFLQESAVQDFMAALEDEEEQDDEEVSVNEDVEKIEANKKLSDKEGMNVDKDVEADDDWVSEDEEEVNKRKVKRSKPTMEKKILLLSGATAVTLKTPEVAIGSCKTLRSRKVQNASTGGFSLTIQQQKLESDNKEADLKTIKRKLEKEVEAVKRKEEIMKRRTEAAKRKREEKMANVKRTREEIEKGKAAKLKKCKAVKKPIQVEEVEVKSIISPVTKVATPKVNLNITFDMKKGQKEGTATQKNSQCLPAVQLTNLNDYGMADNSDCSSEEEDDPRKKIPAWAQIPRNNCKLLAQDMLPHNIVSDFWYSKPAAPTIKEFFGGKVSSKTLRRGLDYRTSSACWNIPPIKK